MPPAARVGDPTSHPGMVGGPGVPNVLIESRPAANITTLHICSFPGTPPHPPSPFAPGSATVLIGGSPAVRMGDVSGCGAPILMGAATVMIGG
jgi:uncharacterized Zn-binding protein involved in type VI secretion